VEQNEYIGVSCVRYYQPVWEELKKKQTARVTAPKSLHRRIIKAVIKEKWQDYGYKIELGNYNAVISYSISNSIITFTLSKRINLSNITEHML
jgi:hypothetical protein